ncbi:hypothetical protein Taro_022323 [Colocasia esculenta]|uniref:Uncharacterized protein n=1 Tax=Colocasia esculenta TaxID=4460 RepID=A0A843UU37_COLES|nr:hypothetical protein [Colocasia esculenta]
MEWAGRPTRELSDGSKMKEFARTSISGGRLRFFSSEDDSLAQVGRVGLLAEGRGEFFSSSAALPFASVAAPICCHRGRISRRLQACRWWY